MFLFLKMGCSKCGNVFVVSLVADFTLSRCTCNQSILRKFVLSCERRADILYLSWDIWRSFHTGMFEQFAERFAYLNILTSHDPRIFQDKYIDKSVRLSLLIPMRLFWDGLFTAIAWINVDTNIISLCYFYEVFNFYDLL